MKFSRTHAIVLLGNLALGATALAAEGETVGAIPSKAQGIATGITALVVFALVAAILGMFVWPKISQGLDDRANKIKEEIEAAEMARQQAKDALEQYQQALGQARAEAQKEIDKARAQAQAIAADLKAKADADLNQLREKAMRDIEMAKRAAVSEVYSQSASLASVMAGKILRREVQAGDTQRLIDESVAQLARN